LTTLRQLRVRKSSGGFSLVEIMVGMTIGLLGMVIMLQMLTFSEGQKRTTSGSDDAQNAGAIALYGLQRDIQQSGYGISAQNIIGCSVTWQANDTGGPVTVTVPLAPVSINPAIVPATARDANTDALLVIYGTSNSPVEGDSISSGSGSPLNNIYTVSTPTSYTVNDKVVAQYGVRQTPCVLVGDNVMSVAAPNITVATGTANIMTTNAAPSVFPTLYNLGQLPKVQVYAVRGGNLTVCDYTNYNCGSATYATINAANQVVWVPIAGNIVSLKAQYGRNNNGGSMTGIVDLYDQTSPATSCNWVRTSAIRVALVAIGAIDTYNVITAAPVWDGSAAVVAAAPLPGSAANPIDLSLVPNVTTNWQKYHYKVFQTTVPIRNISAQGVISGC
jgi:type IV pilus assembly protein PilW